MKSKSIVNSQKSTTTNVKNAQMAASISLNANELLSRAEKRTTTTATQAAKRAILRCDSDATVNTRDMQNKIITVISSLLAAYLRSDAFDIFLRRKENKEKRIPKGMGKVVGVNVESNMVGLDVEWNDPLWSIQPPILR
jgi:hypothetical protein